MSDGAPSAATCMVPDSSPSFITDGPATRGQSTLSLASPAARACFSTSWSRSISIMGRKATPNCWAAAISSTSARAAPAPIVSAATAHTTYRNMIPPTLVRPS